MRGLPTPTTQAGDLAWALAGKLILIGANTGLTLILANVLPLDTYGLVIAAIGAQLLVSRGLLLGVGPGVMRLGTLRALRDRPIELERAGLAVIAGTSSLAIIGALLLALLWPWPGVSRGVIVAVLSGAVGTALVDYGYHQRLARLEFRSAATLQAGTALARTVLTALAAALSTGLALGAFVAYCGVSLLSGLTQAAGVLRNPSGRPDLAIVWQLARFSTPLGLADALVVLSLFAGTFVLISADQPTQASLFGLALTLSLAFFALYNAFYDSVLARMVQVLSREALRSLVIRTGGAAVALLLLCIPMVVAVAQATPYLVGSEFSGAIPVFYLLAASMLVLILQAPLEAACNALLQPQLILVGWGVRVAAMGPILLRSFPDVGATSVALAQLEGGVLAAGLLFVLVVPRLRGSGWPSRERLECAG